MVGTASESVDEAEVKEPAVMIAWGVAGKGLELLVLAGSEEEKCRGHQTNATVTRRPRVRLRLAADTSNSVLACHVVVDSLWNEWQARTQESVETRAPVRVAAGFFEVADVA